MKKIKLSKALQSLAVFSLIVVANSRCFFIYHQPKQPLDVKKYRKF